MSLCSNTEVEADMGIVGQSIIRCTLILSGTCRLYTEYSSHCSWSSYCSSRHAGMGNNEWKRLPQCALTSAGAEATSFAAHTY